MAPRGRPRKYPKPDFDDKPIDDLVEVIKDIDMSDNQPKNQKKIVSSPKEIKVKKESNQTIVNLNNNDKSLFIELLNKDGKKITRMTLTIEYDHDSENPKTVDIV